jgi:hypothetical protein
MAKGKLQMTDNIMAKGKLTKDRFFVSFLLALIFFVFGQFPFVHDIVCFSSVSLCP